MVRVNAVLNGAVESALWRRDPDFATLIREKSDEIGALNHIAANSVPLVRCGASQDILRLVRLLPTHLSFPQIAERLYVSRHTVKSQVQSVYRKLGASSRREAVEIMAEVGMPR